LIDLSQEIHPGMQLFPVFPKPQFVQWTRRETYGFETEAMFLVTHTGTHVDAPFHFHQEGIKIDKVPPERLVGRGVLLNVTGKEEKGVISASDVREAEKAAGVSLSEGDIVLVRTGWDKFLGAEKYTRSYPGLTKDAADYFVEKKVSAVGVDNPNPDHPDASDFPVHNTLLPRGILIIENLANLGSIKRSTFRFVGLPLKIRDGTGSPIRAVAIED
jgi:arylformamidase